MNALVCSSLLFATGTVLAMAGAHHVAALPPMHSFSQLSEMDWLAVAGLFGGIGLYFPALLSIR